MRLKPSVLFPAKTLLRLKPQEASMVAPPMRTVVFLQIVLANSILDIKIHHMNKWKYELSKNSFVNTAFSKQIVISTYN